MRIGICVVALAGLLHAQGDWSGYGMTRARNAFRGLSITLPQSIPTLAGRRAITAGEFVFRNLVITGADTERGILYMPFGSANNDYYGVDRQGNNLFANSIVAIDAMTGKLKW